MPNDSILSARLDPVQHRALRLAAAATGTTASALAADAIGEHLQRLADADPVVRRILAAA